jgi:hypothetical protein
MVVLMTNNQTVAEYCRQKGILNVDSFDIMSPICSTQLLN